MKNLFNYTTKCNGLGELAIVYNGGAGIEKKGFRGVSHIVEHCQCERMKSIDKKLTELGIGWNAYTDSNCIAFVIYGQAKNIKKVANEFVDLIVNYKITKDVFEREKEIVNTEYNMYVSDQDGAFYMNLYRRKFNDFGSGGDRRDIETITYDNFMKFHDEWYAKPTFISFTHPENESDMTTKDISGVIKGGLEFNDVKRWNRKLVLGEYNENPVEVNSEFKTQRELCAFTTMTADEEDTHYFKFSYMHILQEFLTGTFTSLLIAEIREKEKLVYSIKTYPGRLDKSSFIFMLNTSCKTANMPKVVKKLKAIFKDIVSRIDKKTYESLIRCIKAKIETAEFTRCSNILDAVEVENINNFTKRSKKLLESYKEFKKFVKELGLDKLDYVVDDEFKN